MVAFLHDKFVPIEQAVVSIFDRGFLYGDGLFESIRYQEGKPFLWQEHVARLETGIKFLRMISPWAASHLLATATELMRLNQLAEGMCRIVITRGPGPRGYSPRGASSPTLAMSSHPIPALRPSLKAITASLRLPAEDPLSLFKTSNKLRQVLARAEADDHEVDEAIMCNSHGLVVEGTSSNLFWVSAGVVQTPALVEGILPGVTRSHVLRLCERLNIPTSERAVTSSELAECDGVFLTSSGWGIAPVSELDGVSLPMNPIVPQLQKSYWA